MTTQTFVKTIHIQLPYERRNIGVLEILPVSSSIMCSLASILETTRTLALLRSQKKAT